MNEQLIQKKMSASQTTAYDEWNRFAKEMNETDLSWIELPNVWNKRLRNDPHDQVNRVDWNQLGMPSFKGEHLAEVIMMSVKTHPQAWKLMLKHWRFLPILVKCYQEGDEAFCRFVPKKTDKINDYLSAYQSLKRANSSASRPFDNKRVKCILMNEAFC